MRPARLPGLILVVALLFAFPRLTIAQWQENGIPVAPVSPPGQQDLPRVAPDGMGGLYVVWRDLRDYSTNLEDIYLQRMTGDGLVAPGWPSLGLPTAIGPVPQEVGMVAPDGAGGCFVAWEEFIDATLSDIFVQRIRSDGSISPGWPKRGVPVSVALDYQRLRDLVSDQAGGVYVAWTDFREGFDTPAVYLTRITAEGQLANGWIPDGNRLIDLPESRHTPALLGDPSGDVFVAWGDARLRSNVGGTFYVTRITPSGSVAAGWPAHGVPLFLSGTGQDYARIVSDGAGGAYVGWNDNRQGGPNFTYWLFDVYAQHILGDGTIDPRWPRNGLAVCDAPDGQWYFTMAPDGAEGALFAWQDHRGGYWQIYGQRVRPDGTLALGWTPNGNQMAPVLTLQFDPQVIADGAGGLYAFWEQNPSGYSEVAGQHLLANGQLDPAWGMEGLPISSGDADCTQPDVIGDGKGGALLAFERSVQFSQLIYAQRVRLDGPVPVLLSLMDTEVSERTVTLRWHSSQAGALSASVERRDEGSDLWTVRGAAWVEGRDRLVFADRDVFPGRYGYRLRYSDGVTESLSEEIAIEVSTTVRLALEGFRPNPAAGAVRVSFSLPDDQPARLEVIDVKGRIAHSREVGSLGGGSHAVTVSGDPLPAGMYWIRLVHPVRTLTTRGLILR